MPVPERRTSVRLRPVTALVLLQVLGSLTALHWAGEAAAQRPATPSTATSSGAASAAPRATASAPTNAPPKASAAATGSGAPSASAVPSASATPNASGSPDASAPTDGTATAVEPEPPPPPPRPQPKPTATASASAAPSAAPAPTPPPAPPPPPKPELVEEKPADVRVGDTAAFALRTSLGGKSAAERALAATKALKQAFEESKPEEVRVERSGEYAVVYLGRTPIVQLSQADARISGDASLEVHSDLVAAKLREALVAERERHALASKIFNVSLIVFFAVIVLYLLRRVGEFAERASEWLEDNPHRVPAIQVRSLEVMNPAALQSFAALSIGVGKWLSQFAIVYLWLLAALSLFEPTRGYTDRLNGYILQPFVSLATRLAATLPIAVVVGIAVLVVALVFRVIKIFFDGVREGATSLSWMPPDLARPTSVLVRAGLLLTTFVFLAPVLTGHPDGTLARAGMVALAAILVGCVPLVATAITGIVVVYGRRVRAGEYVEIGEHAGKVIDVSLLDITLDDDDGAETRIPHLSGLTRALRVIGAEPRVTIQVGVERSRANAELREQLLRVIAPIGLDPRAEVVGIERDDVHFSLSVVTEDLDARSRLHLAALEALDGKSSLVHASPLDLELAEPASGSGDRASGAPAASGRPSSPPPGGRR